MSSFIENKIKEASQAYYSGKDSGMTDAEWDAAFDKLKKENPESELLHQVGHGYEVEFDSTPGEKVHHRYNEAAGLDKVYTWKEFDKVLRQGDDVGASLKLDGLSIILYYQKGALTLALTRGKDNIGIDITDKAVVIDPSIQSIKDKRFTGAVRGEIIMSDGNFEEFKKIRSDAENSRNSAAGLINCNDVLYNELQYLDIYVYTLFGFCGGLDGHIIYDVDVTGDAINTYYRSIMSWLIHNFKNVVPFSYMQLEEDSYQKDIESIFKKWRDKYKLPADGVVFSDMYIPLHKVEDGYGTCYLSQAFKFKSESTQTKVIGIEWNTSKSRKLIPVILTEPVRLAGTTVRRATGFNAKFICENKIGVGAVVEIEKRGEIIPNVNDVIKECDSGNAVLPNMCPDCGYELVWEGVHLVCPNKSCGNLKVKDALIWCRTLAPIDGLGDILIYKYLKQILDDISVESIMSIDRDNLPSTDSKNFSKFIDMINCLLDKNKKVSLSKALISLNIPRLGEKTSDKLSKCPYACKKLLQINTKVEAFQYLLCVITTADAYSISEHLDKFHRLKLIEDKIAWEEDFMNPPESNVKLHVAITGKLSVPRKTFEKELADAGITVGDISSNTDILITDNPDGNSSKNKKADKLGIKKVSEAKFREDFL